MNNKVKLIMNGIEYSGELTEECVDPFNHSVRIENMEVKSGIANKYDGGYHIVAGRSNGKTFVSNNSTDFLDAIKYCYNDIYIANLLAEYNKQCRDSWNNKLEIKKVIFNDPATIILWNDNTKTIVKCDSNDKFDFEKGLAMAIAKKMLGDNKSKYYDIFKKWLPYSIKDLKPDIIPSSIMTEISVDFDKKDLEKLKDGFNWDSNIIGRIIETDYNKK